MRILIITSCTSEKAVQHEAALTLEDFRAGRAAVEAREAALGDVLTAAEKMYTGQQHMRLMRGVAAVRVQGDPTDLDLHILSAGYGLLPADRKVAPYDCTFQGMKKRDVRAWADQLEIPQDVRAVLAQPFDLGLILLGDTYLEALQLDGEVALGGPVVLFCGSRMAMKLPALPSMRTVTLTIEDAKRFSCALVALKGELGARVLEQVAEDEAFLQEAIDPEVDLKAALERPEDGTTTPRRASRSHPEVDTVIHIPTTWWEQPHRERLRYFIPDWDDQVDPYYDFLNDEHSGGVGDWSNQVYAHQLYERPNYDGILISKVVAEKSKKKKKRINAMGVHRFLRVPRALPVMGDCGAFGYVDEDVPPYETDEILDYYTRLDFDYGVSIDHLIVKATEQEQRFRYGLTIENAEAFIKEHRAQGLTWEPIGAVQGWDPGSYAEAARQIVDMGYRYIALGGMVRSTTKEVLRTVQAVRDVIPDRVQLHVFGVARLNAIKKFAAVGVNSADSASYLRQAWMRSKTSYILEDDAYAALRIPEAGKSFRAKRMLDHPDLTDATIIQLEQEALRAVRGYANYVVSFDATLNALMEYDRYVTKDRIDMKEHYYKTLEARAWEQCDCPICQRDGVEVVIFRGNNRNRRRGFHNTYVFYNQFKALLNEGDLPENVFEEEPSNQLMLFTS